MPPMVTIGWTGKLVAPRCPPRGLGLCDCHRVGLRIDGRRGCESLGLAERHWTRSRRHGEISRHECAPDRCACGIRRLASLVISEAGGVDDELDLYQVEFDVRSGSHPVEEKGAGALPSSPDRPWRRAPTRVSASSGASDRRAVKRSSAFGPWSCEDRAWHSEGAGSAASGPTRRDTSCSNKDAGRRPNRTFWTQPAEATSGP